MNLQGIGFFARHTLREQQHGVLEALKGAAARADSTKVFSANIQFRAPIDTVELSGLVTALTEAGLLEPTPDITVEHAEAAPAETAAAPQSDGETESPALAPREAVENLATAIKQLADDGDLHPRAAKFFDRMLQHIGRAIDRGAPLQAAIGLTGFMAAIGRATERGMLSEEAGIPLTETARAAFDQLLADFGPARSQTNEAIDEVITTVQSLVEDGSLSEDKGIKIGNILHMISQIAARGHTSHAAEMLERLADRIEKYTDRGGLPTEAGETLTAAIEEAIDKLSAVDSEANETTEELTTQPVHPTEVVDSARETVEAGVLVFLTQVNLRIG